jgi:DNA-binding NtrC family response regulator
MRKVLIVDDEPNVHAAFRRFLRNEFEVLSAFDGREALSSVEGDLPDAVLLDVQLPRLGGLAALEQIRERHPHIPVIVMTAYGTAETAIQATALAAREYLSKPIDGALVRRLLKEMLPDAAGSVVPPASPLGNVGLIGSSAPMQELGKLIGRAANSDATVLITGETGVGKECAARAIHRYGGQKGGPLIAVNCAAVPGNLLESELFGHERGAFTGAETMRPGKFELAHRGTLLLDEIGDMPLSFQAKLLRVLQEREVTRLGGTIARGVQVRVIAITNSDLEARVRDGAFREDLYYRLNVLRIKVPPLRERGGDVRLLADHLLARERVRSGRGPVGLTPEAEARLLAHRWPGNVRELENVIAQACLRARGDRVTDEDLAIAPMIVAASAQAGGAAEDPAAALEWVLGLGLEAFPGELLERVERAAVVKALHRSGGNQVQAAKLLGTTRHVIRNRMEKYSLE